MAVQRNDRFEEIAVQQGWKYHTNLELLLRVARENDAFGKMVVTLAEEVAAIENGATEPRRRARRVPSMNSN
jgi:hypothetical protein